MNDKTKLRPQEDYEYFRKRVRRWVDYFGLLDWSITTEFAELEDGVCASSFVNSSVRSAMLTLSTKLTAYDLPNAENKDYILCKFAFHEVMHVLLGELSEAADVGRTSYITRPMEEAVIRRLENCVHVELLRLWAKEKEQ